MADEKLTPEQMAALEQEVKDCAIEIHDHIFEKYQGRPAGVVGMALALLAGGFTAAQTTIPRDVLLETAAHQYDDTKKQLSEAKDAANGVAGEG